MIGDKEISASRFGGAAEQVGYDFWGYSGAVFGNRTGDSVSLSMAGTISSQRGNPEKDQVKKWEFLPLWMTGGRGSQTQGAQASKLHRFGQEKRGGGGGVEEN